MNILYLGNWSCSDGLSYSTVRPNLKILSTSDKVSKIYYVSIERHHNAVRCDWDIPKLNHLPYSSKSSYGIFGHIIDLISLTLVLRKIIKQYQIQLLICRSTPAGNYGYLAYLLTKIPFVVESFEPHASYMLLNEVWSKWSLKYRLQAYLERCQKKTATALIAVSRNYYNKLSETKIVHGLVKYAPCAVIQQEYSFSHVGRKDIRNRLGISEPTTVGIYTGKFGDIYYEIDGISILQDIKASIQHFHLILLTDDPRNAIRDHLFNSGFNNTELTIHKVSPADVKNYLSAADFAISLVRSTKSSKFCSPIKHGEYWANGLPIIIDKNIGDDSKIIEETNSGLVIDMSKKPVNINMKRLSELVEKTTTDRLSNCMVELAIQHRSFDDIKDSYKEILDDLKTKSLTT